MALAPKPGHASTVVRATFDLPPGRFADLPPQMQDAARSIAHFHSQYGAVMSKADVTDLADVIKAAKEENDPGKITQFLNDRMVRYNSAFREVVQHATHVPRLGGATDMVFDALSNALKIGEGGQVLGIKSSVELQEAFTAFRAPHRQAAIASGMTGPALARHLDEVASIDQFIAHLKLKVSTVVTDVGGAVNVRTFRSDMDGGVLRDSYHDWLKRQAGVSSIQDLTAEHFQKFPPEAYIVCTRRGGRPRALLDAMIGPRVMDSITATAPRQSRGARGFQIFLRAEKGADEVFEAVLGANWRSTYSNLDEARRALQLHHADKIGRNAPEWNAALNRAWSARFPWQAELPAEVRLWIDRGLSDLIYPTAHAQTLGPVQRRNLFARSLGGPQADVYMNRLLGRQVVDLDELAHRLLDAHDQMNQMLQHLPNPHLVDGAFPYIGQAQYAVLGKFVTRSGTGPQEYLFEAYRAIERNAEVGGTGRTLSFGADLPRIDAPDRIAEGFDEVEIRPRTPADPTPAGYDVVATRERKSVKDVLAYAGRVAEDGTLSSLGKAHHQFGQQLRRAILQSGEDIPSGGFPRVSAPDQVSDVMRDGRHALRHTVEFDGVRLDSRFEDMGGVPDEALGLPAPAGTLKADLIAEAEGAFDAANALMADTRPLTGAPGMLDRIADMPGAGSGQGAALRAAAAAADPPLRVNELFLLRTMLHSSETAVPEVLVRQVQAIGSAPVVPVVTAEFRQMRFIQLAQNPVHYSTLFEGGD